MFSSGSWLWAVPAKTITYNGLQVGDVQEKEAQTADLQKGKIKR